MNTGQPAEKPTVEIEKPPAWAIALTEKVAKGFASVEARLDTVESFQEMTRNQVTDVGQRMTTLEARVSRGEERMTVASIRIKEPSAHDLETQAALASEIAAREALAKDVTLVKDDVAAVKTTVAAVETKTDLQTKMLEKLTDGASKLAANPVVRSIATMVGAAILTWLAAHGGVK